MKVSYAGCDLYHEGNIDLLYHSRKVAVIGSRNASEAQRKYACDLSQELASNDCVVVSGMALGIDRSAHVGTMYAARRGNPMNTIAVMPCAVDELTPLSNFDIWTEVKEHGLVVSEFPSGNKVTKSNFVLRNKTIAKISDVVIVVVADEDSGTRHVVAEMNRMSCEDSVFGGIFLLNNEPSWLSDKRILLDVKQVYDYLDKYSVIEDRCHTEVGRGRAAKTVRGAVQ